MVLKRLLITALGALGLGALAAGPTFAQQIPAPDAFGDPQACAADVKKRAAKAVTGGEVGDNGLTPKETAALLNMAVACPGDVGGGIAEARKLDKAAVDAEDELDKAQKRYDDDDSARNLKKRDDAQDAHDEAVAARNAHSGGGTIYESVFVEEERVAEVKAASSAFTKAETAAATAQTLRDTVELENYLSDFAGFDTNGQAYEFETYTLLETADTNEDDDIDDAVYRTYVRIKKQGGGLVGAERKMEDVDGVMTPVGTGKMADDYMVPTLLEGLMTVKADGGGDEGTEGTEVTFGIELIDHDGKPRTDAIVSLIVTNSDDVLEDTKTIGGVNTEYMDAKTYLEAKQKKLADNQVVTNIPAITEEVRRAQAQYDFFAAQRENVYDSLADGDLVVDRLGDNPATPNEVETIFDLQDTPYTVEDYEALTDLQDARDDAAEDLKAAYDARVAATNEVEANQRDTQAYLEQLVTLRKSQKAVADAAATKAEAEEETAGQKTANEKLATAEAQLASYTAIQALDDANPVKALVDGLLATGDEDDDGQTLVNAIGSNHETASAAKAAADRLAAEIEGLSSAVAVDDPATEEDETGAVTANTNRSTDNEGAIAALTAEDDPATEDADETGAVTANAARSTSNADAIAGLTAVDDPDTEADESGAVTANTGDIVTLDGRVTVNEDAIVDHDMKLMAKKMYIDAIGAEMGFDPATGLGTGEGDMSRIDTNEADIGALDGRVTMNEDGIAANTTAIMDEETARMAADAEEVTDRMAADAAEASAREMADTALGGRIDTNVTNIAANTTAIMAEETARMGADTMLGGRIDTEEMVRMAGDAANAEAIMMNAGSIMANGTSIGSNLAAIGVNTGAIDANATNIAANGRNISGNTAMIGELSESLDVVRAGVAASMALAGMPSINGRGISLGVGSFDGESAFAVGFQIKGETTSFKVGVTSASGATGASAGVGFQF